MKYTKNIKDKDIKKSFFVILGILGILGILYFIYSTHNTHDSYSNDQKDEKDEKDEKDDKNKKIIFLSGTELFAIISNNNSFYNTLYKEDWDKRNVRDLSQYLEIIKNDCITPSENDKKIIEQAIHHASKKIESISFPYFNGKKANNIVWKIGLFKDRNYEFGYPHTIGDVILINTFILSNPTYLIRLLIHEKVHVYQKLYPDDISEYLKINKFSIAKKRERGDGVRPNPDIDEFIYTKNNTGKWYVLGYDKENKEEADTDPQFFEHPFERMAIEISRL